MPWAERAGPVSEVSRTSVVVGQLADRVYTLTYARANARPDIDQSAYTLRAYKQVPPAAKCLEDMQLMVLAATYIHGPCVAKVAGEPWSAITFVPSAARPGP